MLRRRTGMCVTGNAGPGPQLQGTLSFALYATPTPCRAKDKGQRRFAQRSLAALTPGDSFMAHSQVCRPIFYRTEARVSMALLSATSC